MATAESELFASFQGSSKHKGEIIYRKAKRLRYAPTTQGRKAMTLQLDAPAPTLAPTRPPIPRHVAAGLKGFTSAEQAYDAAMSFLAGWARSQGRRDSKAEMHLSDHGLQPLMISTAGDATKGGYLVQDGLSQAIIERRAAVGVSRKLATVVPMDSGELTVPMETGGLTVFGAAEAASLTESDFTFGSLGLIAKKRTVFEKVSDELRDDALIMWLDRFVSRAAYALASSEDADFINGDATSTYHGETGLLNALGSAGINTPSTGAGKSVWTGFELSDFTDTMALLPDDFANGNESWIFSPQFYAEVVIDIVSGVPQGMAADGRPLFLNKPVTLTTKMPTTTAVSQVSCLYGSFPEAVVIGDRGLSYASTDQAMGAFDRGLVWLRANSRIDINVHGGGDSSNAGAYVGLSTAAS